ncbi:MAG: hypothetical protein ACFFBD_20305 [Candidatus Hodarchaeota archaeon]
MKFDKWAFIDISRDSVNFSQVYGVEINSDSLAKILPFSSSQNESLKYILIDDMVYFTYQRMNGQTGKGIVLVFEPANVPDNLLGLVPEIAKRIDTPLSESSLVLTAHDIRPEPIQLKAFDIAIYSLLARVPTIIVGDQEEVLKIFNAIFISIPQEFKKGLSFVSQSTSLSENVNLIGMPFSDEVLREISASRGKYTTLVLGDRVYGQYSSQFSKKLASLASMGQYNRIKNLLEEFWQIITESDNFPSTLDFATKNGLHLSDAQLALIMRANYFGKDVPQGLLKW